MAYLILFFTSGVDMGETGSRNGQGQLKETRCLREGKGEKREERRGRGEEEEEEEDKNGICVLGREF